MGLRPSANTDAARLILLSLVILAFALRVYHLHYQSLWRDEVDAIVFARRDLGGLLPLFVTPGHNGPFYFVILHFWIRLAGDSEFSARFLSLICGVLAVPLIFRLGRRWVGRNGGLLAAVLCATSPYLIWYSQEAKMYTLLFLLSVVSMQIYLLALERDRIYLWLCFLVTMVVSVYVHLLAVLIIPFQALLFLVTWPRYRTALKFWLGTFAIVVLAYLPVARWEVRLLEMAFTTGHEFYFLHEILTVLLFAFSLNSAPYQAWLPITLFIFLLLAGIFLYKRRDGKAASLPLKTLLANHQESLSLSLYLFVPILCLYLVSLEMPIFTDRYLITVLPAYLLLLTCGLLVIRQRSTRQAVFCLSLLLAANLYRGSLQGHTRVKSDFRSAAEYVKQEDRGDLMMFVIPHGRLVFDYYYEGQFSWVDPPYTNQGMEAEELDQAMEQATEGHNQVWLIVSEGEMWDSRNLVKGWFEEHAAPLSRGSFARVDAYLYALES